MEDDQVKLNADTEHAIDVVMKNLNIEPSMRGLLEIIGRFGYYDGHSKGHTEGLEMGKNIYRVTL